MARIDFDSVNRGFSGKARVYDAYHAGSAAMLWARGLVRQDVLRRLAPAASLLELNAGTGNDAAFFAELGFRVHATDLADDMVAEIRRKAAAPTLASRLTVEQLSFTDTARLTGAYDFLFSNFGGLNCVPDLRLALRDCARLVKAGGWAVLVVMPPICPWEIVQMLRGHFRTAFRRLRPGGVMAHVAGAHFKTYYFTPGQVARALGPGWITVSLRSLCLFSPPSFMENFPRRFPSLYQRLTALDENLGRWPVLNQCGDFFVYTARRAG